MALKTLIVWDMDGVIAEESETVSIGSFISGLHEFILRFVPDMPLDEVFRKECIEAYVEHGCAIKSYIAPKLGRDLAWVLEAYHYINERHLLPVVLEKIRPKPWQIEKARYLASLPHVTNACMSQGHSSYVLGTLGHVGWLDTVIQRKDVHDIVSVGGHLKRTEEPYVYIRRCYPDYDRYVIIEDSSLNLPPAKRQEFETHFSGMKTVHRNAFPFIDFHHLDTDRVLDHLIANI